MRQLVSILAVLFAWASLHAADLPAPVKTDFTTHDYRKASLVYEQRLIGDAYRKIGRRNPAWDDDAIKLLDMLTIRFNNVRFAAPYHSADDTSTRRMVDLAFKPSLTRCDDPMVVYARAIMLRDSDNQVMSEAMLIKMAPLMLQSNYSSRLKYYAISKYLKISDRKRTSEQKKELTTRLYDFFADYLLEPVENPIERRFKAESVVEDFDGFKAEYRNQIVARLENAPDVDPWIYNLVLGIHETRLGWEARGTGFAGTVSREGWKGLAEHLAKARAHLEQAIRLEPAYPEPAGAMIPVAMGMGNDECKMRDWFDRAISAQIDYLPAWKNYVYGLYPRWFGSQSDMYEFGRQALATGRFDTAVPMFLLEVVDDIKGDRHPGNDEFDLTAGAWNDIRAVFDGYLKNPARDLM